MYRSLFPRDIFAELDRLQRDMSSVFDYSPSIRGIGRGGYPALNVGSTPSSVEIYAFAPGIDPAKVEINLDRGVLTIDGERQATLPAGDEKTALHLNERFDGPLPPRRQPARRHRPECRDRRLPRRRAARQRQAPRIGAAAPHRSAVNNARRMTMNQ